MDELEIANSTAIPTTRAHEPGQSQPEATTPSDMKPLMMEQTTISGEEKPILLEQSTENIPIDKKGVNQNHVSIAKVENSEGNPGTLFSEDERPDFDGETPEAIYGTPETNHETPETPEEIQSYQETDQARKQKPTEESLEKLKPSTSASESQSQSSESSENENGKKPSIDDVVKGIYGIMKPESKNENSSSSEESEESKETGKDSSEEEEDNGDYKYNKFSSTLKSIIPHYWNLKIKQYFVNYFRFTFSYGKVTQVTRPSLSTYLRRNKIPSELQQLALLYDALSKDARKQGFSKFSGFSDELLKPLEKSAEGGLASQLQFLLEKTLERNEITLADTKTKVREILRQLKDSGSTVNKNFRGLIPLKFTA